MVVDKIIIAGGSRLSGRVRVSGSKNAILPILAASILCNGVITIKDCPHIIDVQNMIEILKILGCKIEWYSNLLWIDASCVDCCEIPEALAREMRSSIVLLGSILGRCKQAKATYPGGCEIGLRPINLHLKALRDLKVQINESHGYIECEGRDLEGNNIQLDYPSVGATENIILAAVYAKGKTVIRNAAKEPEIIDLQGFINAMGGKVSGAGSNAIIVHGVNRLHGTEYKVMPDRIVAGTYMVAAAITSGDVFIENVVHEHLYPIILKLREAGCFISIKKDELHIIGSEKIYPILHIETMPYPGFPTDMQAQMMALVTIANGTSVIIENIFENRFKHSSELIRMGANITIKDCMAVIKGIKRLTGASVIAKDLRGGASLLLAGLCAEGNTEIESVHFIDRGYESLDLRLNEIGAAIKRI